MKSKGFTLIELLAVIVILAIIALIATPIVLNIISDSKESATLQSAEFYLGAVETAITKKMIDEPAFKPTSCDVQSDGNLKCDGKEEIIKVEVSGEVPTSGNITLKNGKTKDVQLVLSEKTIIKNSDGKLIYGEANPKEKTLDDICDYDSTNGVAEKTAGAKYSCEVKDGTSYNFFVLTTPEENSNTINLIMERNICDMDAHTEAGGNCMLQWYDSQKNEYGPVKAMDYLYNATKDWSNIPNIQINYTDEGQTTSNGYGTIITENNITKITKRDGSPVTVLTDQEGYSDLKARLPYYSEISTYDSTNKTNAYLYDYLSQSGTIQTNPINGVKGYWTFKSQPSMGPVSAVVVYNDGSTKSVLTTDANAVRPVITLKI